MTGPMRLTAAVVFVRDLKRSKTFYRELLALDLATETGDAVLLSSADGDHLALRALEGAVRPSAVLGVQYLIWTTEDANDLEHCEHVLRAWDAYTSTWTDGGVTVVEGHDPDRTPVLVSYAPDPRTGASTLPARVFAY